MQEPPLVSQTYTAVLKAYLCSSADVYQEVLMALALLSRL
jgi:hypothetical protein